MGSCYKINGDYGIHGCCWLLWLRQFIMTLDSVEKKISQHFLHLAQVERLVHQKTKQNGNTFSKEVVMDMKHVTLRR